MRMPASAYDFESVRSTSMFWWRGMKPTHDMGAKSTYASSTTTTPPDVPTTLSTATGAAHVPVGEFGLTMNLSGAGSSAKSWAQTPSWPVACGAGTASWMRHSGSSSGEMGGG